MTERCPMCKLRPSQSDWLPFCCEVCWDSHDAEFRRGIEAGKCKDLPVNVPPSET